MESQEVWEDDALELQISQHTLNVKMIKIKSFFQLPFFL